MTDLKSPWSIDRARVDRGFASTIRDSEGWSTAIITGSPGEARTRRHEELIRTAPELLKLSADFLSSLKATLPAKQFEKIALSPQFTALVSAMNAAVPA